MTALIKNHIRRLRFENGEITQEVLAQRCNVTRQTIISLEAGKYTPSLDLAMRIAEAFDKKVDDVFFRTPTDVGAETKKV